MLSDLLRYQETVFMYESKAFHISCCLVERTVETLVHESNDGNLARNDRIYQRMGNVFIVISW